MNKAISIFGIATVALVAMATAVCLFTPTATRCDLNYRLAEIDCVRQGVDPFAVWSEKTVVKPYFSNNPNRKSVPDGCNEMISVYVPWEYTLMLPFSFVDKGTAWWAYSSFSGLALLGFLFLAYHSIRKQVPRTESVIAITLPTVVVAHALWSNAQVGNHMSIVLLAAGLMAHFLNKDRQVAAGLCWTLMMIKPQIGLIFAVPIAMRLRFATAVVAVVFCVLLSLYPAIHCHTSLIDMFREPSIASAFAFEGCGTWPKFLCETGANGRDIVLGTVIGAIVCTVMTWLIRKEKDWFTFLMPAAITSCCWTYTQAYSHAMGWFVAFVIMRELLASPRSKFLWILAALSAFSLTRWFLALHGLYTFAGRQFPLSEYAFRSVDSLNSTLSLSLAFALCLWLWRKERPCGETFSFLH